MQVSTCARPRPKISLRIPPQPRGLHLEAYYKEEHHHAEFGDMQNFRRLGEHAEAERADDEAGREIAEHRAETDTLEDRHRDDGRAEQDHESGQIRPVGNFGGHVFPTPVWLGPALQRPARPARQEGPMRKIRT